MDFNLHHLSTKHKTTPSAVKVQHKISRHKDFPQLIQVHLKKRKNVEQPNNIRAEETRKLKDTIMARQLAGKTPSINQTLKLDLTWMARINRTPYHQTRANYM